MLYDDCRPSLFFIRDDETGGECVCEVYVGEKY